MKKLLITLFFICLAINTYQAFSEKDCFKDIRIENLNSKDLLSYLEENRLVNKVNKVCSNDICTSIHFSNLEQDIASFIKKNVEYLKTKGEEISINADLKGFKIDRIFITECD